MRTSVPRKSVPFTDEQMEIARIKALREVELAPNAACPKCSEPFRRYGDAPKFNLCNRCKREELRERVRLKNLVNRNPQIVPGVRYNDYCAGKIHPYADIRQIKGRWYYTLKKGYSLPARSIKD